MSELPDAVNEFIKKVKLVQGSEPVTIKVEDEKVVLSGFAKENKLSTTITITVQVNIKHKKDADRKVQTIIETTRKTGEPVEVRWAKQVWGEALYPVFTVYWLEIDPGQPEKSRYYISDENEIIRFVSFCYSLGEQVFNVLS